MKTPTISEVHTKNKADTPAIKDYSWWELRFDLCFDDLV
jgi:hypothetical protein